MKRQARKTRQPNHQMRWRFVLGFWLVCACVLVVRAVDLQVIQHDFLAHQGDIRNLRVEPLAAHRGVIRDRDGRCRSHWPPDQSIPHCKYKHTSRG